MAFATRKYASMMKEDPSVMPILLTTVLVLYLIKVTLFTAMIRYTSRWHLKSIKKGEEKRRQRGTKQSTAAM